MTSLIQYLATGSPLPSTKEIWGADPEQLSAAIAETFKQLVTPLSPLKSDNEDIARGILEPEDLAFRLAPVFTLYLRGLPRGHGEYVHALSKERFLMRAFYKAIEELLPKKSAGSSENLKAAEKLAFAVYHLSLAEPAFALKLEISGPLHHLYEEVIKSPDLYKNRAPFIALWQGTKINKALIVSANKLVGDGVNQKLSHPLHAQARQNFQRNYSGCYAAAFQDGGLPPSHEDITHLPLAEVCSMVSAGFRNFENPYFTEGHVLETASLIGPHIRYESLPPKTKSTTSSLDLLLAVERDIFSAHDLLVERNDRKGAAQFLKNFGQLALIVPDIQLLLDPGIIREYLIEMAVLAGTVIDSARVLSQAFSLNHAFWRPSIEEIKSRLKNPSQLIHHHPV